MPAINPQALTLARELRRMSQTELAARAGISQGKLSKIEKGHQAATDGQICGLTRALGVPQSLLTDSFDYRQWPQTFFRRKLSTKQSLLKGVRAQINFGVRQVERLMDAVEPIPVDIPQVELAQVDISPRIVAEQLRIRWNMAPGPVSNITVLLERAGVVIIECDFGTMEIDGISLRSAEIPPFIFVNSRIPGDRLRFTLAHELGHLIFHHHIFIADESKEIEVEADEFASEFLMPRRDIAPELRGKVTLERLASMKARWGVSIQALLLKSRELGAITEYQLTKFYKRLNMMGYRKNEPNTIQRERPTVYENLVKVHLNELSYAKRELCDLLGMLPEEFDERFRALTRPDLRLFLT